MTWFDRAVVASEGIYLRILKQPFVQELKAGTLPPQKFEFYMQQDAVYLRGFAEVLGKIAERLPDERDQERYKIFSYEAMAAEQHLHSHYFSGNPGRAEPACHHYLSYLYATLEREVLPVALASVLPCFVIYQEVGTYIYNTAEMEKNPYRDWIKLYSGTDFKQSVDLAVEITEKYVGPYSEDMLSAYVTAAELEYLFWEGAFEKKRWLKRT